MLYREYGKTGKKVSVIGMGGMRFEDQNNVDACAALVKGAYDAGINYFDTAPGYGKSEELYGVAFKEMLKTRSTKPFYVATKTFAATYDAARKELETSLKRTGLDYIDFYHVWCVMSPDDYFERKKSGVLQAFERFKEEGLVKHICISSHAGGNEIRTMLDDYNFDGILLGYSVMNAPFRSEGIKAASEKNMGITIMNPLGGGMIPKQEKLFDFIKTQPSETVVEAALRYLINDKRISVVLAGLSNLKHLEEAISAVEGFKEISASDIERMSKAVSGAMNELCTNCGYCEGCPQNVPITKLMDAYNMYLLDGKNPERLISRLHWHWGIEPDDDAISLCFDCGQCEDKCTQKLPIVKRLKEIKRFAKEALDAKKDIAFKE